MKIELVRPLLARNQAKADENRTLLQQQRVFALDVLGSPGAGKTTAILAAIAALGDDVRFGVIEGDIAGRIDAEKVKEQGVPVVQINTGGACHLEAGMVARALEALPLVEIDVVMIENVGNLVCPTDFDLGQAARAVILSVPEGHDKPVKYPSIFAAADAVILSKCDTMPAFDFDDAAFEEGVRRVNGAAPLLRMSATTGEGVGAWAGWLAARAGEAHAQR